MKTHHMIFLGIGAFALGWIANNLTQGGTAFQVPASGTWFSSGAASQ
jgi:hypothetical protein